MSDKISICPIDFKTANEFVSTIHRHHGKVAGHKFSIAITDGENIRGVAMVGRPISRHKDDGWTLEVTRCCTDGVENGCSMLYRSCWRAAQALGYKKLITYTLFNESGSSLKGAGWKLLGINRGGSWNVKSRPRINASPTCPKSVWELKL